MVVAPPPLMQQVGVDEWVEIFTDEEGDGMMAGAGSPEVWGTFDAGEERDGMMAGPGSPEVWGTFDADVTNYDQYQNYPDTYGNHGEDQMLFVEDNNLAYLNDTGGYFFRDDAFSDEAGPGWEYGSGEQMYEHIHP